MILKACSKVFFWGGGGGGWTNTLVFDFALQKARTSRGSNDIVKWRSRLQ